MIQIIPHTHVVLVNNLIISKIRIIIFSFIDDHQCQQGKCISLGASLPSKQIPIHMYILIGVGVALIGVITVIIGALFWQRRQIKQMEKLSEPLASFSQPSKVSFRNNSFVNSTSTTSKPTEENTYLP